MVHYLISGQQTLHQISSQAKPLIFLVKTIRSFFPSDFEESTSIHFLHIILHLPDANILNISPLLNEN